MANTKKPKAQAEDIIENSAEETVKPAPKKVNKPKHDPNELILRRSVPSSLVRASSVFGLCSSITLLT